MMNAVGRGGAAENASHNNSSAAVIDTFMRDDFQLVRPMPTDLLSVQREIRFSMNYCQANKLNQTTKWLGELLVTLADKDGRGIQTPSMAPQVTQSDVLSENDLLSTDSFSKVYYEEPCPEQDSLNLARSLYDLKEYRKCAHLLQQTIT